jgi:hypothetical protein
MISTEYMAFTTPDCSPFAHVEEFWGFTQGVARGDGGGKQDLCLALFVHQISEATTHVLFCVNPECSMWSLNYYSHLHHLDCRLHWVESSSLEQ